jgi:hypothetical protein
MPLLNKTRILQSSLTAQQVAAGQINLENHHESFHRITRWPVHELWRILDPPIARV